MSDTAFMSVWFEHSQSEMRSAHLQAVAYLIGETAAEKIIAEHL